MTPQILVMFATLSALIAIAHFFVEIPLRAYPAAVGYGAPIALAIVAAVDRQSMRSIWLTLLAVSFAEFNAGRWDVPWLIPVVFAVVAIWLFRASWTSRRDKDDRLSQLAWWVAGTLILILCVLYGPEIVVTVLGIPRADR